MPQGRRAANAVAFPYATMEAAIRDKFKKIGGLEEAYRYIVKGFKERKWYENWRARTQARREEEDAAFEAEKRR